MKNDLTLASDWGGINRIQAPFVLTASESPDTMDAAQFNDIADICGPRRGRTRRATNPAGSRIMGVVPCNFPGLVGRIAMTADGIWQFIPDPWSNWTQAPPATIPTYDKINIKITALNSVWTPGFVPVLSTSGAIGPFDLSTYQTWALQDGGSTTFQCTNSGAFFGAADLKIQGLINGVWTDMIRYKSEFGRDHWLSILSMPATGSLTQIRASLQDLSGIAGAAMVLSANANLLLFKNALPAFPVQSVVDR